MKFIAKKTKDLTISEWEQIGELFEAAFKKKHPSKWFINKYKSPIYEESYHGFMLNETNRIVGAMTIVPFDYNFFKHDVVFGLFVDLMIHPNYRNDIMNFKKIYDELLILVGNNVDFFYAVPNQNSISYFLKILHWKKIGRLNYFLWPIKLSKIVNIPRFFDLINSFFSSIIQNISITFSQKYVDRPIKKKICSKFIDYRFSNLYQEIIYNEKSARYKIYEDNGIISAYLIDIFPYEKKWMTKVISLIYKIEKRKVDVILYVANNILYTHNILKTPEKFEPRTLTLIGKINHSDKVDFKVFEIDNWIFNLSDFDVR